jgi:3-oxoacyl-[acyl-carrier protein] reductase
MGERPVALITMSTGYVGPSLARRLARGGFDLVLHAPAARATGLGAGSPIEGLVAELDALGARAATVQDADLLTPEGNQRVVEVALDAFERLDAACLITGTIVVAPFLETTVEQWELVKRANLDMVFHGLQAVLPPMVTAGTGQVLVFTSATGARPEPGVAVYGSTRAGANGLVRAVGLEVAPAGVVVNAIGTNFMDFPGFHAASGTDDPARRAKLERRVPVRRMGTMDELAEFAAVLLDGRSRFQTGQFFSYSGGWSA